MKPNQKLIDQMNQVLASTYALYLQTQNFHWNVTGPNFRDYHLLFEEQYHQLAEAIDVIAENIRTLDVYVPGTFTEYNKLSQIKMKADITDTSQMVKTLIKHHQSMVDVLHKAAHLAGKQDLLAIEDLMVERLRAHQIHLWKLKSTFSKLLSVKKK